MKFYGKNIGVKLVGRGVDFRDRVITIIMKSKDNWYITDTYFSEDSIDDLITQLTNAKEYIKNKKKTF